MPYGFLPSTYTIIQPALAIDAVDRESAKDAARQLHIDGEQSDDSGIVDGYSTGIDCVDIEIKGEQ